MARYTAWKTVIDGVEKKHRSENKTYEFLRAWAPGQPDGAKAVVYVQGDGVRGWGLYERLEVRGGLLCNI